MGTRKQSTSTDATTTDPVASAAGLSCAGTPQAQRSESKSEGSPRGSVVDRRSGLDRREVARMRTRQLSAAKLSEGAAPTEGDPTDEDLEALVSGLERRRGPGRRLSDFTRSAEEGEMTQEQFLFVMAIQSFKQANETMFPTWCDVLEVIRLLGYRKTMASEIAMRNAEDWRESPLSPSNVRPPRWAEHGDTDARRAAARRERPSEGEAGAQRERRAA